VPPKKYLFTPGPTPVPPQVLAAMAEPVVHHRSPDFKPIYTSCLTRLREVFRTQQDVLLYTASGTGAFESAVANLVAPGEPHLVVSAGNFGERWAAMTAVYGADVDHLRYAWVRRPTRTTCAPGCANGGRKRCGSSLRDLDGVVADIQTCSRGEGVGRVASSSMRSRASAPFRARPTPGARRRRLRSRRR
jgi:hypothetical protein